MEAKAAPVLCEQRAKIRAFAAITHSRRIMGVLQFEDVADSG